MSNTAQRTAVRPGGARVDMKFEAVMRAAREADRAARRELARLVRRMDLCGAGRDGASAMSDYDVFSGCGSEGS
jgi:hypothetical protein